jgi:hypothetical protein
MNKLNPWLLCDELTVVQAVLLIIGENPNDYPNILVTFKSVGKGRFQPAKLEC